MINHGQNYRIRYDNYSWYKSIRITEVPRRARGPLCKMTCIHLILYSGLGLGTAP
jgi:hypothetical protein